MTDIIADTQNSPDLVLVLYKFLCQHFIIKEIKNDICFPLDIDVETLVGEKYTLDELAQELIGYFKRRGELATLAYRMRDLRPHIKCPSELQKLISSIKQKHHNRTTWLSELGFPTDPFSLTAFHAKTDPLFKEHFSALVAPISTESSETKSSEIDRFLDNTLQNYRFIFLPTGGGKSALRRYIADKFRQTCMPLELFAVSHRILPVEYIRHKYPFHEADAMSHIKRIMGHLGNEIRHLLNQDVSFPAVSTIEQAQEIITDVRKNNELDEIYILVDNFDYASHESPQAIWRLIQSIATNNKLLDLDNVKFMFFLPLEVMEIAKLYLPDESCYQIKWQKEQLAKALTQRFMLCAKQDETKPNLDFSLLCHSDDASQVQEEFIQFGEKHGNPAAMWRLGYYLLDEHFQVAYRTIEEKIDYPTFQRAKKKARAEIVIEITSIQNQFRIEQLEENIITLNSSQKKLMETINNLIEALGHSSKDD